MAIYRNMNILLNKLLGNKEIKYVTQVQDVMGVSEDCAVYDLTSQQFYVDINTSTQLISVSDNELVLSGEATDNIYPHGYFLQSVPKNQDIQVSDDNVMNKQNQIDEDTKGTTQTTEITLDEEQCRILEKKGWILIQFDEKMYLLNKNGLQDITGNDDLIQQYKGNTKSKYVVLNTIKNNISPPTDEGTLDTKNIDPKQENGKMSDMKKDQEIILNSTSVIVAGHPDTIADSEQIENTGHRDLKKITASVPKDLVQNSRIYTRLHTNMALKDLPHKMKLGKTSRKRRLIARIESIDYINGGNYEKHETKSIKYNIKLKPGIPKDSPELESLLRWVRRGPVAAKAEDVSVAETLVARLLAVPGSRDMLIDQHVVITKMCRLVSNMLAEGEESRNRPMLVGGRVRQFEPGGDSHFVHSPCMLTNLFRNLDIDAEEIEMSVDGETPRPGRKIADRCLIHVHVAADDTTDGYAAVSLIKRWLPLKLEELKTPIHACRACAEIFETNGQLVTHQTNCLPKHRAKLTPNDSSSISDASNCEDTNITYKRKRQLHACSACATIFKDEYELKEHQKIYNSQCCKDIEPETRVMNDEINKKTNKDQTTMEYLCMYCKKRFHRMGNYHKHMSIHIKSKVENCTVKEDTTAVTEPTKVKSEVHICNICSSSYYYAASLAKHIKMAHIHITDSKINEE